MCVIDDDASVRSAMRRMFRYAGLRVLTFASAEEFLRAPTVGGCVVTDVHLGGMNGLELQVALARRGDSIPMIMITGVPDTEMELEARRLGAIAFLRKPFDAGELLDIVMTAVGEARPVDCSR